MSVILDTGDWGVDVSGAQRHVDWGALADAGGRFAVIKATEGLGFVSRGRRHTRPAAEAGLVIGGYHYARMRPGEAERQAEHFLRHIPDGAALAALDVEWTEGSDAWEVEGHEEHAAWIAEWCAVVQRELSIPTLVYTQESWVRHKLGAEVRYLRGLPLWLGAGKDVHGWPATMRQKVRREPWNAGRKIDTNTVLRPLRGLDVEEVA